MKTRDADQLLKKYRNGATAGFNILDWQVCLEACGWSLKPMMVVNGADMETKVVRGQYIAEAPNGDEFLIQKEPGYRVITFYDFTRWLTAHDFDAAVEAQIGPRPAPPARRDIENTGTCAACFRNIKLEAPVGDARPNMVLHGYRRPGDGTTHGRCLGRHYPPFELSKAGTAALHIALLTEALEHDAHAMKLRNNPPPEFRIEHRVPPATVWVQGTPSYELHLKGEIESLRRQAAYLRRHAEELKVKMDAWQPAPLPGTKKEKS